MGAEIVEAGADYEIVTRPTNDGTRSLMLCPKMPWSKRMEDACKRLRIAHITLGRDCQWSGIHLAGLRDVPIIEELTIDLPRPIDLSPIEQLENIRGLSIETSSKKPVEFGRMSNLRDLGVLWKPACYASALRSDQLKSLGIGQFDSSDCRDFEAQSVRHIYLFYPRVKSLAGIHRPSNLRIFILDCPGALKDLDPGEIADSIRVLWIEEPKSLKSLSGIERYPNLDTLVITHCKQLESLRP